MNILLFNPSWGASVQQQRYNRSWPPLDLLNVAAILRRDGFRVSLTDARAFPVAPKELAGLAREMDWVLATTSPLDRWQCPNIDLDPFLRWTRLIPPEKLIVCGVHGTVFPEEILRLTRARIVLRGEPEASVSSLFRAMEREDKTPPLAPSISFFHEGRLVHTPNAAPLDLDFLPLPAYDLIRAPGYEYEILGRPLAVLETARGCPHQCIYCLKTMYGCAVRHKSIERVAREVESVTALGYRFIYFMDLEFTLNRARVLELCGMLEKYPVQWCCQTRADAVDRKLLAAMASSGCRLIHYGVESGHADTVKRIGKNLSASQVENAIHWTKEAGMATAAFFLLGFPWESRRAWLETERLARCLNPTYASFHFVTPYAGTALADGMGEHRPWWRERPVSDSDQGILRRIYLRYCLRPAYVRELFWNGRNRLSALRLLFRFLGSYRSAAGGSDPSPAPHLHGQG